MNHGTVMHRAVHHRPAPIILRGSLSSQRGHLGPERLSKSRLIWAPISSKLIPVTIYPLTCAKALIFRIFTLVQGTPDKGMSPKKSPKSSCVDDEGPKKEPGPSVSWIRAYTWRRPTLTGPIVPLPLALRRFTSGFGMGPGGSTSLWSPEGDSYRKGPDSGDRRL